MRILIMGAGAVGSYYGAALARSGHDVTFVARGAQLAALRERGLEIRQEEGDFRLDPVRAVSTPVEAGAGIELVLFTVKGYDTEEAARALQPALGPETAVLPLQNGVDSVAHLSRILGPKRVLVGTTVIVASLVAPGLLQRQGTFRRITLAEQTGEVTARLKAIAEALAGAGVEVIVSDHPLRSLWEKFIPLSAWAAMSAASGATVGEIRAAPEGMALFRQLVEEVASVGRASGVDLAADAEEKSMAHFARWGPTLKTSLLADYERKRRVELEHLTGTVVRRGQALGVPTPGFAALYAVLKVRALAFGGLTPAGQAKAAEAHVST